jgi:hypothetical protein
MPRYLYDSDVAADTPSDAKFVAGYVDGSGTYPELVKIRPKAKHLSISIHGAKAKCYDMENGALNIVSGVSCAKRDIDDGEQWPWLYFSVSNLGAVEAECKRQGIWGKVILWGAHYGVADAVPAPFHALQNVSPGYGATGHWDRSVLADHIPGFDVKVKPPKPRTLPRRVRVAIWLVRRWLDRYSRRHVHPLATTARDRLHALVTSVRAAEKAGAK